MDYERKPWDSDYTAYAKKDMERIERQNAVLDEQSRQLRRQSGQTVDGAGFLALLTAAAVGVWDLTANLPLEWWGHVLLIGGTLFVANWFFSTFRWLTKLIVYAMAAVLVVGVAGYFMQ